jgi:hypothetical protein
MFIETDSLFFIQVTNYIFGFVIYFLLIFLVWEIIYLFGKKFLKKYIKNINYSLFALVVALFLFSAYNFYRDITIKEFTIYSDKVSKDYTVMHITDTQYGSINNYDLRRIAKTINNILAKQNIDIIIFTGDFVDTNINHNPIFKVLDFKSTKFFTLGNHEFIHNTGTILEVIKDVGYQILRSRNIEIDELNIIGIDDSRDIKQIANTLDTYKLTNNEKFNILAYHRPSGVIDAKNKKIDLMLSGHTHGGQFFPFTIVVDYIFGFKSGLTKIDDFHLYLSDGLGVWGPKLRLGSSNDLAIFTIKPKNKN